MNNSAETFSTHAKENSHKTLNMIWRRGLTTGPSLESIEGPGRCSGRCSGGQTEMGEQRVRCQEILGFQGNLDLSMAFMMLRSLRMQVTITTFAGFPAAFRRSAKARRTGLHRIAQRSTCIAHSAHRHAPPK